LPRSRLYGRGVRTASRTDAHTASALVRRGADDGNRTCVFTGKPILGSNRYSESPAQSPNRIAHIPSTSVVWYICQTDAVQGAIWLRFGRVGGTEQVLNQPIHNVAERPAVATGPGDRRFLLPNRFVRSAWALTPTGTPAGRRPDPGPPRRKDGDAQVRDPRFRVGRAPNSWFGGGLQSMTTFPDAGVFSMIATAG
jgi:hypothetical protein